MRPLLTRDVHRSAGLSAMQTQQKYPRTFSFEFFPPQDRRGASRSCAPRGSQLAQLKPRFFSVTFGAGGSTRERTLETVLEIRPRGTQAAPHISCIGSTSAPTSGDCSSATSRRGHPAHRRAARRPALGHARRRASSATRTSWSRFIRAETGDCVPHRGRRLSGVPSAGAQPERRPAQLQAQGRRRRERRDHAVLLQRRRLLPLRRRVRGARASTSRSSPASCRSAISPSSRASPTPAAPRSRAGSACKLEGFGDDTASIRAFGLDVVTDLCDRLLARRRARACTSTR